MANPRKKKTDLPPKGPRNSDPITGASGAHPIEAGAGAAVGAAATGMAIGAATGPIGAAVGAVVGGVVGGYAGKALGEVIDPTEDDTWLNDNFSSRPYARSGKNYDSYVSAFRFGGEAERKYQGRPFEDIQDDVRSDYESSDAAKQLPWDDARLAVHDAYERTCYLRQHRGDQNPKPR
jgi:hypothetical protein